MKLSLSQEKAKYLILNFLKSYESSNNFFILEGSAGTGKSTLITNILEDTTFSNKKIVYSATTNKAVSILKKYSHNPEKYSFCTIHKLLNIKRTINNTGKEIYDVTLDNENIKVKSIYQYDIIIIDEASMISQGLLSKLINILNKIKGKIIFLGDPAQLPPVNESNSLIFYTKNIPRFKLKEIMRYKGKIIDLCDEVRNLVFKPEYKIKFNDFKCNEINLQKNFEKTIIRFINFIEKKKKPIYLVYTNKQCDFINSKIREYIFSNTKNKYEENDIILFNNFYQSPRGIFYYTSHQFIIHNIKINTLIFKPMNLDKVLNSFKIKYTDDFINLKNSNIEIKNEKDLTILFNVLFSELKNKHFNIYELTLNNNDIIQTIHESDIDSYNYFINDIKEKIKEINSYVFKKYKRCKILTQLISYIWSYFYQNYIDILADINYGYCITTHKSQGSNYKSVFVDMKDIITNNSNKLESYRCLYTAITRTTKYLNIYM
tara:strand:- start:1425 stop:2891 length:1467 start_codon:yes stop_codon:yes gene_type:complete